MAENRRQEAWKGFIAVHSNDFLHFIHPLSCLHTPLCRASLAMQVPNLILFYVEDPLRSAKFYELIFEATPAAMFPTYVAFGLPNGLTFSLWSVNAKNFLSGGSGHRSELAFMVPSGADVRALHERWHRAGIKIEQNLQEAVFGLTFVALDPDGHRIPVCTPDDGIEVNATGDARVRHQQSQAAPAPADASRCAR